MNQFATIRDKADSFFFLDPKNRDFVQGSRKEFRLNYRKRVEGWFALLLFGSLAFMCSVGLWSDITTAQNLTTYGAKTTAQVIRLERGNKGDPSKIGYRYKVENHVFFHEQAITGYAYDTLQLNSQVEILYLPSQPRISALAGENTGSLYYRKSWIFLALVHGTVAAVYIVGLLRLQRTNWVLRKEGIMLEGIISSGLARRAPKGWKISMLEYEFTNPAGKIVHKQIRFPIFNRSEKHLPDQRKVLVVYVTDDVHQIL